MRSVRYGDELWSAVALGYRAGRSTMIQQREIRAEDSTMPRAPNRMTQTKRRWMRDRVRTIESASGVWRSWQQRRKGSRELESALPGRLVLVAGKSISAGLGKSDCGEREANAVGLPNLKGVPEKPADWNLDGQAQEQGSQLGSRRSLATTLFSHIKANGITFG